MAKITVLPDQPMRCIVCGRDLPRGRKEKCYICRPPKSNRSSRRTEPDGRSLALDIPYTLADRVAQAMGYGISYGQFMAIVHNGGKLPPLKRPIVWPEGSAHAGE